MFSIGAVVTFDYRSFLARCRRFNSYFDAFAFFTAFSLITGDVEDEKVYSAFEVCFIEMLICRNLIGISNQTSTAR